MASTTVSSMMDKAATVVQDALKTRWTEEELIGWLNEAYQAIVLLRPDANAVTEMVSLVQGSKQTIPNGGSTFVSVTRNDGGMAIRQINRTVLDDQIPNWHNDPPSPNIEHYIHDPGNPGVFYVYPPASAGARVEMVYSSVPVPHADDSGQIKLDDRYAPAILDYILYRAYQKDADYAANDQRSASAYQTFLNSLGVQSATPTSQS